MVERPIGAATCLVSLLGRRKRGKPMALSLTPRADTCRPWKRCGPDEQSLEWTSSWTPSHSFTPRVEALGPWHIWRWHTTATEHLLSLGVLSLSVRGTALPKPPPAALLVMGKKLVSRCAKHGCTLWQEQGGEPTFVFSDASHHDYVESGIASALAELDNPDVRVRFR